MMMKKWLVLGAAAGLLSFIPVLASAQEATPEPTAEATEAVFAAPPSARIDGMTMIWQDLNRCSAASFTIMMLYYEWEGTYSDMIRALNPTFDDVSVRLDEMIHMAEVNGLKGLERTGGTIDMIKLLVANGFPVLVENTYYDGNDLNRDWTSHNRVIMGYDDALGVLYTYDPLLGAGEEEFGRPVEYADFETRWRPFHRNYLVIYRPEQEALIRGLLGRQWDTTYNAEWSLAQADADIAGEYHDSFALFNRGTSLVALGRFEEAAAAFDEARAVGLPWRMLWYQFGPLEAYLQIGRTDDALNLALGVINDTPGVEEMYYYVGRAREVQGDFQRAESNYQVAVQRNPNFQLAQNALLTLRTQLGTPAS